MSTLFSPYALRSLKLPNRIVVSPMCQYVAKNGQANSWHLIHLGGLALSGAGLLFIEATAVEPDGRITPGCLGLWDDATEAALRHLHEFRAPRNSKPENSHGDERTETPASVPSSAARGVILRI